MVDSVSGTSSRMNSLLDLVHEWRIWLARRAVLAAMRSDEPTVIVRYRYDRMIALTNSRSPTQVQRMERRMGLR